MMYQKFPIPTEFMFYHPDGGSFTFSSDLEKIGIENDVAIRSGTYIEVISEPVTINRPKYGGDITVVQVQADIATDYHTIVRKFWLPTSLVVKLEENATTSSELSN